MPKSPLSWIISDQRRDHGLMDIAITGASGLIGTALTRHLTEAGHNPIPVTRDGSDGIGWNPADGSIDAAGFEGIDAVVHLAGAGIGDKRWNAERKAVIRDSRVDGTRLLASTLAELDRPPATLLSGSAIGYYGDRGREELTETSDPGTGFLTDVVLAWEAETAPAESAGVRVAHLRTGIVLSAEGGALAKLLPLFRFGIGGKLGSGDQWWSCISIDDEVAMIEWLLHNDITGPVNLVGPDPTTNAVFAKTLGGVLDRPTVIPVPAFGPKLLLGGELADNLLFTSARVHPKVATDAGYRFIHPTLEDALRGVLRR